MLAAFRAPSKKRKAEDSSSEAATQSGHGEAPASVSSSFPSQQMKNDTAVEEATYARPDLQLSLPVATCLQEVYFTCMFNSTLVFHRPTFSRSFQQGRLPQHVLLAVYASSTIFLPPASTLTRRHANLLRPLGDLRALGRQWAIRAGREVLQDIDQPSFESVQTCEMLALFWFSAGESQRNTMFSGIAYKAACTLRMDLQEPPFASSEMDSTPGTNSERIDAEMARRCFWAVWFTQCINSDHHLVGTSYDDRIMNLPLPRGEADFVQGFQQSSATLSTVLEQYSKPPVKEPASPSIMAELMILILNWAKIRDLIHTRNRASVRNWLADMFELEGQLSSWSARLPDSLTYSKRNLYQQLVVNQQPVYIFVHALYHQCRLVLHSSLAPQFSGLDLHKRLPSEAASLSTRIALKSAQELSEIGADVLALDWDVGQIAPFVGYCMYVSASIHITLLGSRDATLAALARANLISNLKLLKSVKVYWTNLKRLWVRINVLYGGQISRHRASASDRTAGYMGSQAPLGDLDRLAGETRDTGELSEPLADSVLEYTLRRLKPDAKIDSSAVQELERTLHTDDLSQLMENHATFPPPNPSAPMTRMDGQSYSAAADQVNNGSAQIPPVSGPWDRMGPAPIPSLQSNGYDWWQLSFDCMQQPILPYDELFGWDFYV